jgi:hypothetical protein
MAQAKLVHNPFLCVVKDSIVTVDVLGGVERNGVALGIRITLSNSRRIGHMLVGCPSISHSTKGG